MTLLSPSEMHEVFSRWQAANPQPASELDYVNAYTLLVAVVLSAQSTDKGVNKAIKTIGLYRNKAKHIMGLSQKLLDDFDGEVPCDREALMTLPGVGRKTANVVLNVIFHQSTMPVDTHLLRISPKIGLAQGTTPEAVEQSLLERIPPEFLPNAHHWILLHGRYICTARNPKCSECLISDLCKKNFE